jgi:hypothetical protein
MAELRWLECPKKDYRRIKDGLKNSQKTAAEATYIGGSVANEL